MIGSIVCFVFAATARHRGVAVKLLEAACDVASGDAANYHGPLELYLRAGFSRYREAGYFVVVRRSLGGGAT